MKTLKEYGHTEGKVSTKQDYVFDGMPGYRMKGPLPGDGAKAVSLKGAAKLLMPRDQGNLA